VFILIGTEPIKKLKTRKMKNIGLEHILIAGVVGYFAYQHFFKKKAATASNDSNGGGTTYSPQVPSQPGEHSMPPSNGGNVSRGPSKPSTGSGGSSSTGSDWVTIAPMRGVGGLNSSSWNKGTGPTWGLGGCDCQMGWL